MSTTVNVGTQQTAIINALVPREGPKAVSVPLDFTTATGAPSILIDFTQAYMQTTISMIQSVWIDNFANASPVRLAINNPPQTIEIPPHAQGCFPVISAIRAKIVATSAGGLVVPCLFLNVPLPVGVWYESGNGFGGTVDVSGTVDIGNLVTITGTVDVSGGGQGTAIVGDATSVAVGGTPVVVFAAGEIVNGAFIVNPFAATEALYINMIMNAGTVESGSTFALQPGQRATIPPLTGSVTANAVTTGHVLTAVRY
jgi:hypothetical protein